MEFLRFGSSIPGEYWGCCAVDIIQNYNMPPDTLANIQMVSGDTGTSLGKFAGPTLRDIFKQRIRIGTHDTREMPNHSFITVLTDAQLNTKTGKEWLAILKEEGFEFIRTVDNSVYTGNKLDAEKSPHPNHIFGLFRNIGKSRIKDPLTPPRAWSELPQQVPEVTGILSQADRDMVSAAQTGFQEDRWTTTTPPKLMTEKDVIDFGQEPFLAGQRLPMAGPQKKSVRASMLQKNKEVNKVKAAPGPSFPVPDHAVADVVEAA